MKGAKEVAAFFAANLRRVRRAADLNQEEVGFRSSLHRTEVGLLERGARVPRIDTVIKLAAALEVSPGRLLEGITWTPAEFDETRSGEFKHNPSPAPVQAHQTAEQPLRRRLRRVRVRRRINASKEAAHIPLAES